MLIVFYYYAIFLYFAGYFFIYWYHLVFQSVMTDQISSSTPAKPNLLLHLKLIINLNPETMLHDDMHNIKYGIPYHLYKPVLFEPLGQIKSWLCCV